MLRSSGHLSPDNPLMRGFFAEARQRNSDFWEQQGPEFIKRLEASLESFGSNLSEFRGFLEKHDGLDDIRRWIPKTIYPLPVSPLWDDMRETLEKGTWTFYRTNMERRFITGDNPVKGNRLGPRPEHRNHIYFSMPLSENVLVSINCGDAVDTSGRFPILGVYENPANLELQNLLTFQDALRFVYSSSEHELDRAIRWSESGLSPLRDNLP